MDSGHDRQGDPKEPGDQEALRRARALLRVSRGLAHDFNNLLFVIGGHAGRLERIGSETGQESSARQIREASERAGELVAHLQAMIRAHVPAPRNVDPVVFLGDAVKLIGRALDEGVSLSCSAEDVLPWVHIDPTEWIQALLECCLDISSAMSGGGRIVLTAWTTENGEGPGIRLSLRASSVRWDAAARKRLAGGLGSGLEALAKAARRTAADLDAMVVDEREFRVDVRLGAVGVDEIPATTEPRGGETILVVEDDDRVRRVAREMLQGMGYTVLEASGGREALAVLDRGDPRVDLLLTDVVMPEMGGLELARRATALRQGLRVLYISGAPERMEESPERPDSPWAFLPKPFGPGILGRKVRELLDAGVP